MTKNITVGLFGSSGRMGLSVLECTRFFPLQIAFARCSPMSMKKGCPVPTLPSMSFEEDLYEPTISCDVWIDFSHFSVLSNHIQWALATKTPLVIGTSGHTRENFQLMEEASKHIPLLFAPNFSPGIAWLKKELASLARIFPQSYIDITDFHHATKKDSPSGTALSLANQLSSTEDFSGKINLHSYRIPSEIGEHRLLLTTDDETIEIRHKAHNRSVYAKGSLQAASFLATQNPGLYSFEHIMNISTDALVKH